MGAKELKDCPHCGGRPNIGETEGCDYVITCGACGAQVFDDMKWGEDDYDAKANVIKKWNKRNCQELTSEKEVLPLSVVKHCCLYCGNFTNGLEVRPWTHANSKCKVTNAHENRNFPFTATKCKHYYSA